MSERERKKEREREGEGKRKREREREREREIGWIQGVKTNLQTYGQVFLFSRFTALKEEVSLPNALPLATKVNTIRNIHTISIFQQKQKKNTLSEFQ